MLARGQLRLKRPREVVISPQAYAQGVAWKARSLTGYHPIPPLTPSENSFGRITRTTAMYPPFRYRQFLATHLADPLAQVVGYITYNLQENATCVFWRDSGRVGTTGSM
jgi:hypothetical protein